MPRSRRSIKYRVSRETTFTRRTMFAAFHKSGLLQQQGVFLEPWQPGIGNTAGPPKWAMKFCRACGVEHVAQLLVTPFVPPLAPSSSDKHPFITFPAALKRLQSPARGTTVLCSDCVDM